MKVLQRIPANLLALGAVLVLLLSMMGSLNAHAQSIPQEELETAQSSDTLPEPQDLSVGNLLDLPRTTRSTAPAQTETVRVWFTAKSCSSTNYYIQEASITTPPTLEQAICQGRERTLTYLDLAPGVYSLQVWSYSSYSSEMYKSGNPVSLQVPVTDQDLMVTVDLNFNPPILTTKLVDPGATILTTVNSESMVNALCQEGFANCDGSYAMSFAAYEPNSGSGSSNIKYDPSLPARFIPRYFASFTVGSIPEQYANKALTVSVQSNQFNNCKADLASPLVFQVGSRIQNVPITCDTVELDPEAHNNSNTSIEDNFSLSVQDETGGTLLTVDGSRKLYFQNQSQLYTTYEDILEVCLTPGEGACDKDAELGKGGWERFLVLPQDKFDGTYEARRWVYNPHSYSVDYEPTTLYLSTLFGAAGGPNNVNTPFVEFTGEGKLDPFEFRNTGVVPFDMEDTYFRKNLSFLTWSSYAQSIKQPVSLEGTKAPKSVSISFCEKTTQQSCNPEDQAAWTTNLDVTQNSAVQARVIWSGEGINGIPLGRLGLVEQDGEQLFRGMVPTGDHKEQRIFEVNTAQLGESSFRAFSYTIGYATSSSITFPGSAVVSGTVTVKEAPTVVTPVAPKLIPSDVCEVEGTVEIPKVEGIEYTSVREGQKVTVTATATEGFVIAEGAQTVWVIDIPKAEDCEVPPTVVTPVAPKLIPSDVCEVEGTVEIPEVEGIEYTSVREGQKVTVTATATEGFVIAEGAQTIWVIDIPRAEDCEVPVKPTDPTGNLAATGASTLLPLIASGLLLGGAGVGLLVWRRKGVHAE